MTPEDGELTYARLVSSWMTAPSPVSGSSVRAVSSPVVVSKACSTPSSVRVSSVAPSPTALAAATGAGPVSVSVQLSAAASSVHTPRSPAGAASVPLPGRWVNSLARSPSPVPSG
jgi:hypothetical protein